MAASEKARKKFGRFQRELLDTEDFISTNTSNLMRTFYMKGQRAYRKALEWGWQPQEAALNDTLQELNDTQREGFLMGWQSDAYAYELSMIFAVEGTGHDKVTQHELYPSSTKLPWMNNK
jgi:hypothetical protein